jgi:hypothetical protein
MSEGRCGLAIITDDHGQATGSSPTATCAGLRTPDLAAMQHLRARDT